MQLNAVLISPHSKCTSFPWNQICSQKADQVSNIHEIRQVHFPSKTIKTNEWNDDGKMTMGIRSKWHSLKWYATGDWTHTIIHMWLENEMGRNAMLSHSQFYLIKFQGEWGYKLSFPLLSQRWLFIQESKASQPFSKLSVNKILSANQS